MSSPNPQTEKLPTTTKQSIAIQSRPSFQFFVLDLDLLNPVIERGQMFQRHPPNMAVATGNRSGREMQSFSRGRGQTENDDFITAGAGVTEAQAASTRARRTVAFGKGTRTILS